VKLVIICYNVAIGDEVLEVLKEIEVPVIQDLKRQKE